MLAAIRNSLNSWIVKALFVLLIASFAVWGIGDFMGGGRGAGRSVAHVSGSPVSLAEAADAFQRDLAQMRRSFGGQFEPTAPVREALAEAALGRLVALRALDGEAEARGIAVPDEALREAVFAAPAFHGADGRFSRTQFQAFLRSNGLTEERFLALLRSDLARGQLLGSVRVGATAPAALAAPVLAFRAERRVAELVELPFIAAPAPPEPTEDQLRRHHENNPDAFTAPEFRAVAFLLLTLDDVARDITVGEAELRAAFAERARDFATPERRVLAQAVTQDETLAHSVADSWRGGAPLGEIVARVEAAGGSAGLLGTFTRDALPIVALAEVAFALPEGGVSAPVRTPFGWHVLRAEAIEPATTRTFEEAREDLRASLARERAADLIYTRANRVEDSIAAGIPLDEVARRHGLRLIEIAAIDATGRAPDGADVDLQGVPAEALAGAFDAGPGALPRLTEAPDGTFYALRLDSITPPALRPFESVAAEVRAGWEAAQRRRAMEEEAAGLLAAIRGGATLEEAARRAGWTPRRTPAFTRDGRDPGAPPAPLVQALFALPRGEATMIETTSGFLVGSVAEIQAAQPGSDAQGLERLRRELSGALAEDIETQFIQAVRERAGVRIEPNAIRLIAGESP